MNHLVNLDLNKRIQIATSTELESQLMVCSHERSGTHFLMNTIGHATDYSAKPWLNYDLIPLGADINFHSEISVKNFITNLANLDINGQKSCNASILKSHFPLRMLGKYSDTLPLKIIYIYRDPAEVFISFWKFLHQWEWDEGPKARTPSELLNLPPSGQSQRYQLTNHKDYFERWSQHTLDGINYCENNPNACHISYKELLENHESLVLKTCNTLGIKIQREVQLPARTSNVIPGKDLFISGDEKENLKQICASRLKEIPELDAIFK